MAVTLLRLMLFHCTHGPRQSVLQSLLFLSLSYALCPLALGIHALDAPHISIGLYWIVIFFLMTLAGATTFAQELTDGTLDVMARATLTLEWQVFARVLAVWLTMLVPILIFGGTLLSLGFFGQAVLLQVFGATTLGTLALTLLTMTCGVLTLETRAGTNLTPLLTGPLTAPTLIFATMACLPHSTSALTLNPLWILGALCLLGLPLQIFIISRVLKSHTA